MHAAIASRDMALMQLLYDGGMRITQSDLVCAVSRDFLPETQWLLDHGASPSWRFGSDSRDGSFLGGGNGNENPLARAAVLKPRILQALMHAGADLGAPFQSYRDATVLHLAIEYHSLAAIRLVLAHACPDALAARNSLGETALDVAIAEGSVHIAAEIQAASERESRG